MPIQDPSNVYSPAEGERYRNNIAFDTVYIPAGVALNNALTQTLGKLFQWGQGEAQNGWAGAPGGAKPDWAVEGDITEQKLEGGRVRVVQGFAIDARPFDPANANELAVADILAVLTRTKLWVKKQGQEGDCIGLLLDAPAGVGVTEPVIAVPTVAAGIATANNGQATGTALRTIKQPFAIDATKTDIYVESKDTTYTTTVALVLRVRPLGFEIAPVR